MTKCPECNNLIEDDEKVCSNCGYPFEDTSEEMEQQEEDNTEKVSEEISENNVTVSLSDKSDSIKSDEVNVTDENKENDNNSVKSDEIEEENNNAHTNGATEQKYHLKNKFLNKRIVYVGVGIIGVFICLTIFVPKIREQMRLSKAYKNAIETYDSGEYETAAKMFSRLGKYRDSKEQYLKCFYSDGIDNYEEHRYADAINCFEKASEYKDAKDKIKETHFMLAEEEFQNGNYKSASNQYKEAGDYNGASDKYNESIYEYGKQLVSKYDYDEAAKEFEMVEYKDSQELAKKYERMDKERFFEGKFHYASNEFAILLSNNLKDQSSAYSAELTKEKSDGAYIELKYYGVSSDACVMLQGVDSDDVSIEKIIYLWNDIGESNASLEVGALYLSIRLADISISADEAKDMATNMLSVGVKKQNKNGIVYESAFDGTTLGLSIYAENTTNNA